MKTICPKCGMEYDLDDSMAGIKVECECGEKWVVGFDRTPTAVPRPKKQKYDPTAINALNQKEREKYTHSTAPQEVSQPGFFGTLKQGFSGPANKDTRHGCVIAIIVLALIGWGLYSCNSLMNETRERDLKFGNMGAARYVAEETIKSRLKAPSTAEITFEKKDSNDNGKYSFSGYVDAENSFGAKLRNRFRVELEYAGDGKYKISSCTIL